MLGGVPIPTGLNWILLILTYVSLGVRLFALIDAVRRPSAAYEAAGKLTKTAWVIILAVSVVVGLLFPGLLGIFNLAGLIAAIVYIVDVRPAVREITRPGPTQGPYGSW
jgi:hypothetical protein